MGCVLPSASCADHLFGPCTDTRLQQDKVTEAVDHGLVGHIAPLRFEPPHVVRVFAIATRSACARRPARKSLAKGIAPPVQGRAWAAGAPPAKPCLPAPCVRTNAWGNWLRHQSPDIHTPQIWRWHKSLVLQHLRKIVISAQPHFNSTGDTSPGAHTSPRTAPAKVRRSARH